MLNCLKLPFWVGEADYSPVAVISSSLTAWGKGPGKTAQFKGLN